MGRQPAQVPLVRTLQGIAGAAATSRLYLAQTLSGRVAQSEFAAVQARNAAEQAIAAANAAGAAAASALSAANAAVDAANAANTQAGAAANAAANAASAAAGANDAAAAANQRVAVLELTDVYTSDGSVAQADVPTSYAVIPGMRFEPGGELLRYPHMCNLSLEVRPSASGSKIQVAIGLRTNQRELNLSDRSVICTDSVTMETSYSFIPLPGETYIEAVWSRASVSGFNAAVSPAGRRQLSILRIGTP